MMRSTLLLTTVLACVLPGSAALAHHVLGRPSYSLNEDSNTPPSMQVETQIGDYFVTYMAFPAFPRPNEPGRVNLYARHLDTGRPFLGEVTFTVVDDNWFETREELLGRQPPDDNVFRQGFEFRTEGFFVIRAEFQSDGQPYLIDFPLRVGDPLPIGPVGVTVGLILVVLVAVNIIGRRRLARSRFRANAAKGGSQS
jgi:hypothetical protein